MMRARVLSAGDGDATSIRPIYLHPEHAGQAQHEAHAPAWPDLLLEHRDTGVLAAHGHIDPILPPALEREVGIWITLRGHARRPVVHAPPPPRRTAQLPLNRH